MRKLMIAALVLLIPASVFAEEKFVRTVKQGGKTIALETATAYYEKEIGGKKIRVDVYGAVHVADKAYYIRRNVEFELYDKVLYELVSDEPGQRPKKGKQGMYAMFKTFIELENQLGVIDYQAKNFLHADLTKKELTQKMRANGDNMMTLLLEFMLQTLRQQNKTTFALEDAVAKGQITARQAQKQLQGSQVELDLLQLLTDPNRAVKIKRMMANSMDKSVSTSFGPTIGGYLIDERNKKCISVLKGELAKGDGSRYAIFYGAAHMPDMEKRLLALGFKRTKVKWTRAWDNLRLRKSSGDPLLELLRQLQKLQ